MIETLRIDPGFHVMASLATQWRAIGTSLGHAVLELPVMRIHMASGAALILEMKG